MNYFKGMLVLIMIALLTFTGCQLRESEKQDEKEAVEEGSVLEEDVLRLAPEAYPRVDGSTATIPLSLAAYMQLTGATTEEAEAAITHTKTSNAYMRLLNKEVDLLIVYSAPESIELEMRKSPVKLEMKPIGKDALVFLTNEKNVVESLTTQEIIDIYQGKIVNWSEVGGDSMDIVAFQRPDDSGSQAMMMSLVMKDNAIMDAPSYMKPSEMGELIDRLVEYNNDANALGYSVYYYAKNMYEQPDLKFLKVDGVAPESETIQEGSYPFVKEFYAVIRKDESKDSNAYKVYEWLTSEAGQELIKANGYVSIK